jgi:hypothetical protein
MELTKLSGQTGLAPPLAATGLPTPDKEQDLRGPSREALQRQLPPTRLEDLGEGKASKTPKPAQTDSPVIPDVKLSATARSLSALLSLGVDLGAGNGAAIKGSQALLPSATALGTQSTAAALTGLVVKSGLFYESHLLDFMTGKTSRAALVLEPQARLAPQTVLTPQTSLAATGLGSAAGTNAGLVASAGAGAGLGLGGEASKAGTASPTAANLLSTPASASTLASTLTASLTSMLAPAFTSTPSASAPTSAPTSAIPSAIPAAAASAQAPAASPAPAAIVSPVVLPLVYGPAAQLLGGRPYLPQALTGKQAVAGDDAALDVDGLSGRLSRADMGAASSAAPAVHPEALALVRQQLELLATPQFRWSGEAWPGTPMDWEIRQEEQQREPGDESFEPLNPSWRTRLVLTLPSLKSVDVHLSLSGSQLQLRISADADTTRDLMGRRGHELSGRFSALGLELSALQISALQAQAQPRNTDGE